MDYKELMDILGDNKEEVLRKAVLCKTAEELMKLAGENKIALTREDAVGLLNSMNPKAAELTADELDAVAGGGPVKPPPTCTRCGKVIFYCQCRIGG
jgi:hypothetical protein